MSFTKREREDYNRHREHVGKEFGLDKNKYNALRRAAQGLHRADEDSAMGTKNWRYTKHNWGHDEAYTEKHHKNDVNQNFSKAEAVRKKAGGKKAFHFYHQSDPRGASLYVGKEKLNQANYSSKGKHIY